MKRTLFALTAASALLLAACGSDSSTSSSATTTPAPATAAATPATTPATAAATTAAAVTTTSPPASTAGAATTTTPTDFKDVTLNVAAYPATGWDVGFKAAGLEDFPYTVKWATFPSGADMITAINAGSIDVASSSEIPPIFAGAAGAQFKSIAVIQSTTLQQEVVVPAGSPLKTIADLKGKKVAYVKATTAHYFLLKMLQSAGLTFDDITPVALSAPDGLAALQGGSVDAMASYGVSIITAKKNGATTLATAADILSGNFDVVAGPDAINDAKKHAAVADFLGRLQQLADWQAANVEAWAKVTADATKQPLDQALQTLEDGNAQHPTKYLALNDAAVRSQQDVADTFFAAGLLPKKVDVTTFWDTSFTDELNSLSQ